MGARDVVWILEKTSWSQELARLLELIGYRVEVASSVDVQAIESGAVLVPESKLGLVDELVSANRKDLFPFVISDGGSTYAGPAPVILRSDGADAVCAFIDHQLFSDVRKHPRLLARVDAVLSLPDRRLKGHSVNLSGGGALLVLPRADIETGKVVPLRLNDKISQIEFSCHAIPRRVQEQRAIFRKKLQVGVQFIVTAQQQEELDAFVREVEYRVRTYPLIASELDPLR